MLFQHLNVNQTNSKMKPEKQ